MKIELTVEQVIEVVHSVQLERGFDELYQRKLALLIFSRNNNIDPFFALKAVVKQIASEHCMTREQVLEQLK